MLTVSNYHYIREDFTAPYPSIFGLTPEIFEKQLLLLKEIGTFIHPKDLLNDPDAILQSEQNFILVTFDDGLKEQFDLAKPILDKLNISALFFVNSINHLEKEVSLVHKIHLLRSKIAPSILLSFFAESDSKYNLVLTPLEKEKAESHYNYDDKESASLKYLLNFKLSVLEQSRLIDTLFEQFFDKNKVLDTLYMSEFQIKNLGELGMLGSHTHSHFALGLLESEVIKEELSITKEYLEQLTKGKIRFVSYPYGSDIACANPVPELAKESGYIIGFTIARGINRGNENKLLLKRFDCNDLVGGKNFR